MDGEGPTSACALPAWADGLFAAPLAPVQDTSGRPTSVWSIAGGAGDAKISDQFKADADQYHARYAASAHFEALFRQALTNTGLQVAENPLILDLGSGSGVNSIVPSFNLFPGARQVATDLSVELLAILAEYGASMGLADRMLCVEMDATSPQVVRRQFDLVTGASILHHLERPVFGLWTAAQALKPGGYAIFLEPFDGYGLIRLAYERILAEAELRNDPLAPEVAKALHAMVADIAVRTIRDPSQAASDNLDDKWLFSREHLETAAGNCGFSMVRFIPHNDHEALYRDVASIQLRLSSGLDTLVLPEWAMDILDSFDRAMPPAVKRLLMLEGTVVLTKGG